MTNRDTDTRLNFQFYLLYDLKWMSEIESIARGEASHSDASLEDIVDLFNDLGEDIPECLNDVVGTQTIWVLPDGTWLDYEPLKHEQPNARKVKIDKF